MQSGIKVQHKLRLSNWKRGVSFTPKALELEMQSGIIVQQAEALEREKIFAFTLEALELGCNLVLKYNNWRLCKQRYKRPNRNNFGCELCSL